MWAERRGEISRSTLSSIHATPDHRSVPAPTTSCSTGFFEPRSPLRSIDFWPAPLRSNARFKGQARSQISPPTQSLSSKLATPADFFIFSQVHAWLLITYRLTDNNMIILLTINDAISYRTKSALFYILPPNDLIPTCRLQASHQLYLALLCSEIPHIKTVTHWNETEAKQLQNSCETIFISFIQCSDSLSR